MSYAAADNGNWIRRELTPSLPGSAFLPEEPWTPLDSALISRSYMSETHGGGRIEELPGSRDRRRAMTAGLPSGQPTVATGLVPQGATDADDRDLVPDTTRIPWRSICQLLISRQDGTKEFGTAWFAGPSLLVTAGHCVLDHGHGGWASTITVVPASNGTFPPPFSMWQAAGIEAHPRWVNNADPMYDYAFISLADSAIGKQLGWFGFSVLPDDRAQNLMVNIAGYPANRPTGSMWSNSGRIASVEPAFLAYMLDTEAGDSGSPVFWFSADQRVVVAVHAYRAGLVNKGLRITAEMYHRIVQLRGF